MMGVEKLFVKCAEPSLAGWKGFEPTRLLAAAF
jgi:hypothetical protein